MRSTIQLATWTTANTSTRKLLATAPTVVALKASAKTKTDPAVASGSTESVRAVVLNGLRLHASNARERLRVKAAEVERLRACYTAVWRFSGRKLCAVRAGHTTCGRFKATNDFAALQTSSMRRVVAKVQICVEHGRMNVATASSRQHVSQRSEIKYDKLQDAPEKHEA